MFGKKMTNFWQKYKEIINYIIFGVLTTVVNWVIFQLCVEGLLISWGIANVVAWIGAVLFAYITNRVIVFQSASPHVLKELLLFVQFRVISLLLEMMIMFVMIEMLSMEPFISKIFTSVVVVIANYIFSKVVIFK